MRLSYRAAVFTIAFTLLSVVMTPTAFGQAKPVVMVTVNKLDELFSDFSYMSELLGFGQIGQMGTMMAGQFTEGLDQSKPIGIVVTMDDGEVKPMVMVPVSNLDTFLAGIEEQIGEPRKAGNGVLELAGPVPMYLKQKDGWAFVTQSTDDLKSLPSNPMKLLGGIASKYDISVRGYVQNVPDEYKEMAIAQIREGVEMQLDNLPDNDESDAQRKMIENAVKQYETLFKGLDRMTIGISIDEEAQKTIFDLNMTAVPGTKVAKQMGLLKNLKSRFSGFLMKDSAITMNVMSKMLPEDAESAVSSFDMLTPQLVKGIEEESDLDDVQKDAATKVATTLMEVLRDTIANGEVDMGMSVLLQDKFTMVMGMGVSDGAKVEEALKAAAEAIEADEVSFRTGVDQHAGVRMHRLSVKVDENDEEAVEHFGDKLEVFFGIADKSVYVSAGEKGMEYLRKGIDASKSASGKEVLPMRMKVSVAEIMKYVQRFEKDDDTIESVVDELEKVGEAQSQVLVVAKPIDDGAQYRIEVREGVLKAIGRAVEASQAPAGF